jgi:transcription initiation factor TFIIH subunit 4
MFVGAITRDSVRQALVAGITAEQMVAYLRLNVLPTLRGERGAVPLAVQEQIRLWASERARVRCAAAAMYALPSRALFDKVLCDYGE